MFGHRRAYAFSQFRGSSGIRAGQHGDKFLAAESRQNVVRTHARFGHLRTFAQDVIATVVAVRVVHFLEEIQIVINHRQWPSVDAT